MISAQRAYAMLGNESLWETAKACHELFVDAGIPYAIAGGMAVCLHGYQRNTVDVDLLIPEGQPERIRNLMESAGISWNEKKHEFRTPSGVAIHFLITGERAGKDSEIRYPDPADPNVVTELEGLSVLSLAALIESKIASGQSNL